MANCSGNLLYGHAGFPITSADPALRLRATRLFLLVHSELLQMLVQRVDPELGDKGDGLVVDAILSIDTDRPSLKPLYRSALQVRNRFIFFAAGWCRVRSFCCCTTVVMFRHRPCYYRERSIIYINICRCFVAKTHLSGGSRKASRAPTYTR